MAQTPAEPYAFHYQFCDFEEFADAIRAWDLDFRQLDPGRSPATLTQIGHGSIQLTHACFNRQYDQRGAAPRNTRTFALLERGVTCVRWCGRSVTDHSLLMFDPSGTFEAVSQPSFKVFTFAVPEDLLAEIAQTLGLPDLEDLLGSTDNTIDLMPLQAHALRSHMSLLARSVTTPSATLTTAALRHELEFDIPHGLVQTIASSSGAKKRPRSQRRQAILNRAVEYITESPMIPIRVSELCRITGASERTLEYAFKEHYGITPKRFITHTRLNGVRKRLLEAAPGDVNITDVANGRGFWHMGQFAADYRGMFGELPSDTLNRSNVC